MPSNAEKGVGVEAEQPGTPQLGDIFSLIYKGLLLFDFRFTSHLLKMASFATSALTTRPVCRAQRSSVIVCAARKQVHTCLRKMISDDEELLGTGSVCIL